uniref:Uncharacterized protein n=1 Tax=Arundo donax TaxID=35708 RepID=A0A0A9BDX5_ARUDO
MYSCPLPSTYASNYAP